MPTLSQTINSLPKGWIITVEEIDEVLAKDIKIDSNDGSYYKGDKLQITKGILELTGNLSARLSIGMSSSLQESNVIQFFPDTGEAKLIGKWEVIPHTNTNTSDDQRNETQ